MQELPRHWENDMDRIRITKNKGVCAITFHRPDQLNAIDDDMTRELTRIFEDLATDTDTRVVTIAGAGKHFSAGGDLSNISSWLSPDPDTRGETFSNAVRTLSKPFALALQNVPQPVVVAVRGHAIGIALQIVLLADLVVASETAKFTLPQVSLAHVPDHGETWSLARKVGMSRAMQMTLMSECIDAVTAERFNLVNWVTPDNDLDERLASIAASLAACPPVALRSTKSLMVAAADQSLSQALDGEIEMLGKVARQDDFVEAITAFTEKRKPVFKGH